MKPIPECELWRKDDLILASILVYCPDEGQIWVQVNTDGHVFKTPKVRMFLRPDDAELLARQLQEAVEVSSGELSPTVGGYSPRVKSETGYVYGGFIPHEMPVTA